MTRHDRLSDVAEVLRLPHYAPFLTTRVAAAIGLSVALSVAAALDAFTLVIFALRHWADLARIKAT